MDDEVKVKDPRYPTFRYRLTNGAIEKRLFESEPPPGWSESPADLAAIVNYQSSGSTETISLSSKPPIVVSADVDWNPPKRRGRPPKVRP